MAQEWPKDIHSPEATLASDGIRFCNELFEKEKALEECSKETRQTERLKQEPTCFGGLLGMGGFPQKQGSP